jgi:uncharacterized membrane protein
MSDLKYNIRLDGSDEVASGLGRVATSLRGMNQVFVGFRAMVGDTSWVTKIAAAHVVFTGLRAAIVGLGVAFAAPIAAVVTLVGLLGAVAWKRHADETKRMAEATERLSKAMSELNKELSRVEKTDVRLKGIREEFDRLRKSVDEAGGAIAELRRIRREGAAEQMHSALLAGLDAEEARRTLEAADDPEEQARVRNEIARRRIRAEASYETFQKSLAAAEIKDKLSLSRLGVEQLRGEAARTTEVAGPLRIAAKRAREQYMAMPEDTADDKMLKAKALEELNQREQAAKLAAEAMAQAKAALKDAEKVLGIQERIAAAELVNLEKSQELLEKETESQLKAQEARFLKEIWDLTKAPEEEKEEEKKKAGRITRETVGAHDVMYALAEAEAGEPGVGPGLQSYRSGLKGWKSSFAGRLMPGRLGKTDFASAFAGASRTLLGQNQEMDLGGRSLQLLKDIEKNTGEGIQ